VFRQLAAQASFRFDQADDLLKIADSTVADRVPTRFSEFHRMVAICVQDEHLVIATHDTSIHVPELASAMGVSGIDVRLVTPTDYERLRRALQLGQFGIVEAPHERERIRELAPQPETIDAETIALFDAIILDAVANRASDIHFEMYGNRPRLRIRVDGDMREVDHFHFSAERFVTIVNVGKVRARLDIAERRAPQGGRFSTQVHDQVFDVRVQTQPSLHAEHLVLRLLPQDKKPPAITDLGFSDSLAASYERMLRSPGGLMLVVGPTGSGKSTTLYAGLQLLAQDETRKVMSIEDPIEYAIDRVQQSQVLPEVGFTFANAMRAFVREDPDVILVGEIRDKETALEAIRASQTGHLVLSTLHCNDTVDAVQRLVDLEMHPTSVSSELLAVISQRLAKRICASLNFHGAQSG
jgi:type IV pilus assembly protein PilB